MPLYYFRESMLLLAADDEQASPADIARGHVAAALSPVTRAGQAGQGEKPCRRAGPEWQRVYISIISTAHRRRQGKAEHAVISLPALHFS